MKQSVSAEWLKLRHSRIVLVLAVLPVISLLIGGANFYFNQDVLRNGWYSLWSQISLFYGEFFLPILIAICCSYLCRLEHINRNWHMILAIPVSVAHVYLAKWVVSSILILFTQAFFLGLYWLAGTFFSLPQPFPIETIGWTIRGWYASLSIIALQLGLSLRIRSFATPIGISLCGILIGLSMYTAKLGLFFPFSLLTIGISALSQAPLTNIQVVLFWTVNMVYVVIFSLVSIRWLKKRERVLS